MVHRQVLVLPDSIMAVSYKWLPEKSEMSSWVSLMVHRQVLVLPDSIMVVSYNWLPGKS